MPGAQSEAGKDGQSRKAHRSIGRPFQPSRSSNMHPCKHCSKKSCVSLARLPYGQRTRQHRTRHTAGVRANKYGLPKGARERAGDQMAIVFRHVHFCSECADFWTCICWSRSLDLEDRKCPQCRKSQPNTGTHERLGQESARTITVPCGVRVVEALELRWRLIKSPHHRVKNN